jgi:hypothetical protein
MLPTPIISTETLASCAEAIQTEAPKTIDANRDRFIIHQIILAPLARTPKVGCCVSSSDRDFYRNAATNDARKSAAPSRVRSTRILYSITTNLAAA